MQVLRNFFVNNKSLTLVTKKLIISLEQRRISAMPPKKRKAASDEEGGSEKAKSQKTKKEKPAAKKKEKTCPTDYEAIDYSCTTKNKHGETFNVRISNWNVDGLRAWVQKDGLSFLEYEKPDILCLQETKCSEDKLPDDIKELQDYKMFWHNSNKEGYAGVALFSLVEPLSIKYGIGNDEHDTEGRCITAEYEKYYVVSVYVPNAGRRLVTLPKRLEWNKIFKKFIKELDKQKPVIICGDMNVAHSEIDLANPKTNTKNAGFTKEEREGMTDFLSDGYVDTFRKLYPDQTGAYTFWTYMRNARSNNVGWRLDYFIVSDRLVDNVCDNKIRSGVFGSDHCPITLFMNI
ncbi:hypothetical protein PPYR_05335 [Photinus pyralis]|uniref:DNA repair nuclease/redox regulator APEX1 n=1 Tax=Photinus pyralis TaxID=7054 RepID=A0A1Y1KVJ7_PHOPY|nr:DNA-(apurinic or apyrimidinic site) lyase [Photinus pyralis]KAB0800981.1 hypothetical protein PPYR_05335 [Photinus pyralis]